MRLYSSSFLIGNNPERLVSLAGSNKKAVQNHSRGGSDNSKWRYDRNILITNLDGRPKVLWFIIMSTIKHICVRQ